MEERTVGTYSDEQLIGFVNQMLPEEGVESLSLIRQGPANRVYCLQSDVQRWAVKCLGPATFSAVNYPRIKGIQNDLARQGLAPEVVGFDENARIWLEKWIDTPGGESINIKQLAAALARVHKVEISAPTLALLSCWQHYLEQLPPRHQRGYARERDKLQPVITQSSDYQDFCFCHNDLSYSHLVGHQRDRIIDWEYAAVGNRYFDLAACALINQLSARDGLSLCISYAQCTGLAEQEVVEKFNTFLPVVDFTNRLWSAAAEQQNV